MKDNFDPKYIKKSIEALDKHLREFKGVSSRNQEDKKRILKETSLWHKIFRFFKS
jgi:hypothetical protein